LSVRIVVRIVLISKENAMSRFLPKRAGALLATALVAALASTSVYANETDKQSCPSSQPTTGSRIQSDQCRRESDDDIIEVIHMIGAVLEPGDADETDVADATPELPMLRADEAKAADGAKR
jgi:hypothetical protein